MVAPITGISKEALKHNKEKWDSCLSKYKKVFKMKKKTSKAKKYTFSVFSEGIHATDKSSVVYPKKINCCCNELEIEFTDKIEEAMTWPKKETVEIIANEYYNSEIIEI